MTPTTSSSATSGAAGRCRRCGSAISRTACSPCVNWTQRGSATTTAANLLRLLTGLDQQWIDGVDSVARMDGVGTRAGEDLDLLLVELLSAQPDPWSFEQRGLAVSQDMAMWEGSLLDSGLIMTALGLVTLHAVLVGRLLELVMEDPWAESIADLARPLVDPVANYSTPLLHRRAVTVAPRPPRRGDGTSRSRGRSRWSVHHHRHRLGGLHRHLRLAARAHRPPRGPAVPAASRSGEVSAVFPDTHDPAIGFGLFDTNSTVWLADWPLVEAAGATAEQTAAVYLAALADEARAGGTTSLLDTPGFTDAAVRPSRCWPSSPAKR